MIYAYNNQNKIEFSEEQINKIKKVIDFALKEEEVSVPYEISVLFVDNDEIRQINRENRNIDRETDVLSFPMLDYENKMVFKECYKDFVFDETFLDGDKLVLGDIVLSLEKALQQSKDYNHSFEREVSYLVVHSVLHLLGYDHDTNENEKEMFALQEKILANLNINR